MSTTPSERRRSSSPEDGVRAEQRACAKFDLNHVMYEPLPAKLKHPEKFLP